MSTYVVGDIQGCYLGLMALLEKLQFNPQKDKLYAVGDLIGRGPNALETLDFLYQLGDGFDTVLGNHDLHFLAVYHGIKKNNPKDGFEPLLRSSKTANFVEWLRHKPLAIQLNSETFLSHAGLYPYWNINEALGYSQEVEKALQSDSYIQLLRNMYHKNSVVFSSEMTAKDRFRFIIDAFTRMRYLCEDGTLEYTCKTSVKDAPKPLIPWFKHSRITSLEGVKLIFGHWASLEGTTSVSHCIALDTGYIWGGKLSAICLDTMQISSVSN
ncbi:symmetrical bis(5'-nucleosyl)-tetraphosphatase [Alteromonas sp. a30]|uniref:symmetrical bis(5'-nucleosyl)-tetraphosphatase n=1 Tax=Alteromonas sp. a30 TaxID=2730917 RepID=UPI00227E15EF|nr:symmetrical bis(5'-nucleosyl)-tetraphosphatase [Alteromonas sp. a30]MCY7294445.1 symmetrical bis(5'-nucleosyl)-tetraphosphatase [Alteromonas sp. a30]